MEREANKRVHKMRTRAQEKMEKLQQRQREEDTHGLTEAEYWKKYVSSEADIIRFYQLYKPEYPDVLSKSIASRIAAIVAKSQAGLALTDEEKGYYLRSQMPSMSWDPREDLKEHELAAKVQLAVKKLSELDMM